MANGLELIWPTEWAKEKVLSVQEYTLLAAQSIANIFRKPLYVADMVQQADLIGWGSLPTVVLTGFFTGGVLALQTSNTLERFGSITLIGQLVSTSMVRELGPVLTGLMVAGRNTSGMASELGSMVVTEQIDAMRALGTDPMKKLGDAARERNRVHAVVSHHHLGSSRHIWRLVHRQADSHPGCDAVFAQCVAVTGVSRRIHGTDQAGNVRIHHRDDWQLLRDDFAGRDTRRGPRDHAGGRCGLSCHPSHGLIDHQSGHGCTLL
jgi:Permease MlaE